MSTSPAVQVDPTSLDTAGISIATSVSDAAYPRQGTAYDLSTLAAIAPVWVHRLYDGRWLTLFNRRWTAATVATGGHSGVFSAYTESQVPGWALVDGATGHRAPVVGSFDIPIRTDLTSMRLIGAVSKPPNLLFVLQNGQSILGDTAVAQRFHLGSDGSAALAQEEIIPPVVDVDGNTLVVFNKGVQLDGKYLVFYGTDSANKVHRCRKSWGRIGAGVVRSPAQRVSQYPGTGLDWEYYTGTGWSVDITEIAPVQAGLITQGPMSFGMYQNRVYLTTVEQSGSARSGHLWASRSGRPWSRLGPPVPLGTGGGYLGGGLQLMEQLAPNPENVVMTTEGVVSGLVYVVSILTGSTGANSLTNSWGIIPITA